MRIRTMGHVAVSGVAFVVAGCATVVTGGGKQQISFNSEPTEATVTVAGKTLGKTPLSTTIDRDKNLALIIEKEGYKPYNTQLSTSLNGWFWGNIVIGGFFGSTTDAVSGAMYEYSPNQYFVTLVPQKPYGVDVNRSRDIKQLVVGSGVEVRQQLANGQGEHVDALLTLIQVAGADRTKAVDTLKNMAATIKDDLELAKRIIEVYEVE